MAGRGSQSFQKRQKELARKEKQQEKMAKRLQRKNEPRTSLSDQPIAAPEPPFISPDESSESDQAG